MVLFFESHFSLLMSFFKVEGRQTARREKVPLSEGMEILGIKERERSMKVSVAMDSLELALPGRISADHDIPQAMLPAGVRVLKGLLLQLVEKLVSVSHDLTFSL